MTNQQHPITPPPELVTQWIMKATEPSYVPTQAAQWGADQELEACGRWLEDQLCMPPDARADVITQLNGSRRPKPSSLKDQALALLKTMQNRINLLHTVYPNIPHGWVADQVEFDCLYRALEALPND
jgi:hypothetical protein